MSETYRRYGGVRLTPLLFLFHFIFCFPVAAKVFSEALLEAMRPDGVQLGPMGFLQLVLLASSGNNFETNWGGYL